MLGFKTIEEFTLEECEAFLKRTDISEKDCQCAENRKRYLLDFSSSSHEPELKHEVTPPQLTIIELFPEFKFMPTTLGINRKYISFADYVCTNYHGNTMYFLLFVKNRKFGLYKLSALFARGKVVVAPEYDKLTWRKRNLILVAEKDGKQFLIDIYGNVLT